MAYNNILPFESWIGRDSINESSYNNMGFTFDDTMKVQDFLVKNSFMSAIRTNGKPAVDGKFGEESRTSLINFQKSKGLESNGTIDSKTVSAMGLSIIIPVMQTQGQPDSLDKSITSSEKKLSKSADFGEDFIQIIDPTTVGIGFTSDFKPNNANEWILKGYKNFINLTYYERNYKPTGNFYSNGVNLGEKLNQFRHWPMMILKPELEIVERAEEAMYTVEGFSGSDLLIKNGSIHDVNGGPSEMAMRPRTGVGITTKGDIIAYVTPKANIKMLAEKMKIAGAVNAVCVDSGNSTFFVRNGEVEIATSRKVPTILYW